MTPNSGNNREDRYWNKSLSTWYWERSGGLVTKLCLTLMTPWTIAHQAPLSIGFCRQEYWSGLWFPSPGGLPDPGIEPRSPAVQADSLPTELPWKTRKRRGMVNQVLWEISERQKADGFGLKMKGQSGTGVRGSCHEVRAALRACGSWGWNECRRHWEGGG